MACGSVRQMPKAAFKNWSLKCQQFLVAILAVFLCFNILKQIKRFFAFSYFQTCFLTLVFPFFSNPSAIFSIAFHFSTFHHFSISRFIVCVFIHRLHFATNSYFPLQSLRLVSFFRLVNIVRFHIWLLIFFVAKTRLISQVFHPDHFRFFIFFCFFWSHPTLSSPCPMAHRSLVLTSTTNLWVIYFAAPNPLVVGFCHFVFHIRNLGFFF